ncbi:MAG: hypothetical protein WBB48_11700 [Thermodesulfobacteriota bacterium]
MQKILIYLPILLLTVFLNTDISKSDVLIENGGISRFAAAGIPGIMSLDVVSGAGQSGDYILLTCGSFKNPPVGTFNTPDPAIFTELDTNSCGSSNICIEGIWGGFTNNPGSEILTCNTSGASLLLTAGTLRYSNVDPMNPVIGISCNEGNGLLATAPSIATEAGSQVVRIFTSFAFTEEISNDIMFNPQAANFTSESTIDGVQVSSIGSSTFFNSAGATGTADQSYVGSARDWRACTIALRMEPAPPTPTPVPPTPTPTPTITPPTDTPTPTPTIIPPPDVTSVPTLGQWGHLSVGIFAVLIGVWFLRRHKIKT